MEPLTYIDSMERLGDGSLSTRPKHEICDTLRRVIV